MPIGQGVTVTWPAGCRVRHCPGWTMLELAGTHAYMGGPAREKLSDSYKRKDVQHDQEAAVHSGL